MNNRHLIKNVVASITMLVIFSVNSPDLFAQSSDVQALLDRINRLEADLNNVQRKVYQGQDVPAPNISAAPSGGSIAGGGEAAALLFTRLEVLEEEQRQVTGSLEEVNFKLNQMASRLDKLVLDIDFRLTEIERRQGGVGSGLVVGQQNALPLDSQDGLAGGATALTAENSPQPSSTSTPGLAPGSQVLGTLRVPAGSSVAGSDPATIGANAATSDSVVAAVPEQAATFASPAEQYNNAISLIRKDDYAGAEKAFSAFLEQNSTHSLAGNAQYWLGETFYVRGDYANAASSFLNGYQVYPDNSKAADNLLKLAMTLGRMDQIEEACATFKELDKKFTKLAGRLKRIENREKAKFNCL